MLLTCGGRMENTHADTWLALTTCLTFSPGVDELSGLICSFLKADSFHAFFIQFLHTLYVFLQMKSMQFSD